MSEFQEAPSSVMIAATPAIAGKISPSAPRKRGAPRAPCCIPTDADERPPSALLALAWAGAPRVLSVRHHKFAMRAHEEGRDCDETSHLN